MKRKNFKSACRFGSFILLMAVLFCLAALPVLAFTTTMPRDANGNMGIGSTAPQATLDVEGSAYFGIGNVGVGSSAPSQKLDVLGTVKATTFIGDGSGLTGISAGGGWSRVAPNLYPTTISDNVGIGSSVPQAKLDVQGTAYFNGNIGIGTTSPSGALVVQPASDSTTAVQFLKNNGTSVLNVDTTNGRVSVGGASDANYTLYVHSGTYGIKTDGYVTASSFFGSGLFSGSVSYGGYSLNNIGQLTLYATYDANSYIRFEGAGSAEMMRMTAAGNFGIGTTAPQAKLDVEGSAYFGNGNIGVGSSVPSQKIDVLGTVKATAFIGDGSGLTGLTASGWSRVAPNLYPTTISDNVCIGSTVPQTKLDVQGTAYFNGNIGIGTGSPLDSLSFGAVNASGTHALVNLSNTALSGGSANGTYIGANPGSAGADFINFQVNGANKLKVDSAGTVTMGQFNVAGGGLFTYGDMVLTSSANGASANGLTIKFVNNRNGQTQAGDELGKLQFNGTDNAWSALNFGLIKTVATNVTNGLDMGTMSFQTMSSGTLADRITIAGSNIGIGSTAPQAKLDVEGSAYFGNGNVGIGTYLPAYQLDILAPGQASANAPVDVMSVQVGGPTSGTRTGYGPSIIFQDPGVSTGLMARLAAVYETVGSNNFGAFAFYTNPGAGGLTERMRISNIGNVGIGSTAPQSTLDVEGSTYFGNGNIGVGSSAPSQKLDVLGTVKATAFIGDGSGLTGISAGGGWSRTGTNIYPTTITDNVGINSSAPQAMLDVEGPSYFGNGNIGIGSVTPMQKMDVVGNIYLNGNFGVGTAAPGVNLEVTGTTLLRGGVGQTGVYVASGGNVGMGNTAPGAYRLNVTGNGYITGTLYTGSTLQTGGSVGFGVAPQASATVASSRTTTATSGLQDAFWASITANPGADSTGVYRGLENSAIVQAGNTRHITATEGAVSITDFRGTNLLDESDGMVNVVKNTGSGVITYTNGQIGEVSNESTGHIDYATGIYTLIQNIGAGYIDRAFGFEVGTPYITAGAINKNYGIYVHPQTGAGVNYAIFTNEGAVYFGDNVGIGTSVPQTKLDVQGTAFFNGNIGIGSTVPQQKLDVVGTVKATAFIGDGSGLTGISSAGGWSRVAPNLYLTTISDNVGIGSSVPQAKLDVEGSVYIGNGNIGVGSSVPSQKLDVAGMARATGFDTNAATGGYSINGTLFLSHGGADTIYGTAVGQGALTSVTTGTYNTAVGISALASDTDGYRNTAVGGLALTNLNHNTENTAFGYMSANGATGGDGNAAFGAFAGAYFLSGSSDTAIGNGAMQGVSGHGLTGNFNTAVGGLALYNIQDTAASNTALGRDAGHTLSTASGNVFLGFSAGYYETGSNKLFIDNATRASEADARTKALVYGVFDASPANQVLAINGNIGVGSSAPSQKLDVLGTVKATAFVGDGSGLTGLPSSGGWTRTAPNVYLTTSTDKVGIGVSTPSFDLSFGGDSGRSIGIEENSFWLGMGLTVAAGAAHTGASDSLGGALVLKAGDATGQGYSVIRFLTAPSGAPGTSTNTSAEVARFKGPSLGIGTDTPGSRLSVAGNVSIGTAYATLAAPGDGAIILGNVGIGTSAPSVKLEVNGDLKIKGSTGYTMSFDGVNFGNGAGFYITNDLTMRGNLYTDTQNPWFFSNTVNGGDISMRTKTGAGATNNNQILLSNNGTVSFNSGNVGIATTAPQAKLDVEGGSYFGNGNIGVGSSVPAQKLDVLGTVKATAFIGDGSGLTGLTASGWSRVAPNLYPTTITDNVGIGSTTPQAKLDVEGGVYFGNGNVGIGTTSSGSLLDVGTTNATINVGHGANLGSINFLDWRGMVGVTGSFLQLQGGTGRGINFNVNNASFGSGTQMTLSSTGGLSLGSSYIGTDAGAGNMIISGNVGIGSYAPQAKLDVEGSAYFGSGNVGLGSYTPTAKLDVSGGQAFTHRFALTDGATVAVDWNNGNTQSVTLGGNRTFTFANGRDGAKYLLIVRQDGAGSRSVTWPSGVLWPGGVAPDLTTGANSVDIVSFVYDGGNYYGSTALDFR